jgi:hypothetical protein
MALSGGLRTRASYQARQPKEGAIAAAVACSVLRRLASAAVRHARGHARLPLSQTELRAKFLDCLSYGRFEGDAAAFFQRIDSMHAAGSPITG